jgi:molecular chaperone GrpE
MSDRNATAHGHPDGDNGPGAAPPRPGRAANGPAAPSPGVTPAPGPAGGGDRPDGTARIAELEAKAADLEDRWLRSVAELDNVRKRAALRAERAGAEERARVAAEFLPIIDNLELALQHAQADPAAVIEGVRAVRDQALGLLSRLGYPRRDDTGTQFDPAKHEAVSAVPDPNAPQGTVLQVLRPGYGDGERQLRPAAVVVATRAD